MADRLAEAGRVEPVAWAGSVRASLAAFVGSLDGGGPAWRYDRTRERQRAGDGSVAAAGNAVAGNVNVARLWAADEVGRRLAAADPEGAKRVAVGHQLVTAASGAVVLENASQYADHDLTPVAVAPLPPAAWVALATLPLVWVAQRRARARRAA